MKYDRDVFGANPFQLFLRHGQHIFSLEVYFSLINSGLPGQDLGYSIDCSGLSAAGLAHYAYSLLFVYVNVDSVQHVRIPFKSTERNVQIFYIDHFFCCQFIFHLFLPYSSLDSMSLIPSPARLKPSTIIMMARAGNTDIHHWSGKKFTPLETIAPREGVGGCSPIPT